MRNKRYILAFMLFISILMLIVPVIPHHHHANGIICMKNDVTSETQCPNHNHHQQGNDSCCNEECLTRLSSPALTVQADSGPHYVFIATLFTDFIIENLFKPQEQRIKNYYAYREALHGTVINRAIGLRAPPYVLA